MDKVFFREDPLAALPMASTSQQKLLMVHDALRQRCPGVDRVSVALYDRQSGKLKTFLASPAAESPLQNYQAHLAECGSLREIAQRRQPRVVNDLRCFERSDNSHTMAILGHGFASSFTTPLYQNGALAGFVFFDSLHNCYFRDRVVEQVQLFVPLVSEMVLSTLAASRVLVASMRTSISLMNVRDLETGSHLERMSRYAQLIAGSLARQGQAEMDDEQIEQLFLFAPLHDVGKIGVPDRILKKAGKLDPEERREMNAHTLLGRRIVDELIDNFGFGNVPYIDNLRHITESHHEALDGSGYPHGLRGEEIPKVARIVAVSDIFDALTSRRPYKEAWSNEQAFVMLQLMSIDKLDKDCVAAMVDGAEEVRAIQQRFCDVGLQ